MGHALRRISRVCAAMDPHANLHRHAAPPMAHASSDVEPPAAKRIASSPMKLLQYSGIMGGAPVMVAPTAECTSSSCRGGKAWKQGYSPA
jgi:hypothetical protein